MASGQPSSALSTLAEYERDVDAILTDLESQIHEAETDYLRSSDAVGNVATGWEGTEGRAAPSRSGFSESGILATEHVFSASSVTSMVSLGQPEPAYGMPMMDAGALADGLGGLGDGLEPALATGAGGFDAAMGAPPSDAHGMDQLARSGPAAPRSEAGAGDDGGGRKRRRADPGGGGDGEGSIHMGNGDEDGSVRTGMDDAAADTASLASAGAGGGGGRRSGRSRRARRPKGSEDE